MAATSESQHEPDEEEDVARINAIREGEDSGLVSREEVLCLLDSPV